MKAEGKSIAGGIRDLNLFRLTLANLSRNRKRTPCSPWSLSAAIGILYMTVATNLSCASPREIAREDIESDFRIYIDNWEHDQMNPDRAWTSIIRNNPMDEAFLGKDSIRPRCGTGSHKDLSHRHAPGS